MRIEDTASFLEGSSAAFALIGASLRYDGVDSMMGRRTRPTTPGARTSTTATRTTTTRTTSTERSPSADSSDLFDAALSFEEVVRAYKCCIAEKRNSNSALLFSMDRTRNLWHLYQALIDGTWRPGTYIRFVVEMPKIRDVWAPPLEDRIVHWIWHNRWSAVFTRTFIADSCACIPGRGTHYAVKRLDHHVRSVTENWSKDAHYLKCDLWNFFNSIDKSILFAQLEKKIPAGWWIDLTRLLIFHDCTKDYEFHGDPARLELVPKHKRLTEQQEGFGLPIGSLTSQEGANITLNRLDQFVKHKLRCRNYVRYVDDFTLVHRSPQQLNAWLIEIESFLENQLHLRLNPSKTILQPVERGVDFAGYVNKPYSITLRRRTVKRAILRIASLPQQQVIATANSYLGLGRQANKGFADRIKMCRTARWRGTAVDAAFTKASKGKKVAA